MTNNNIKNVFTIQNLENITSVKAHTIRAWEKRYGLFLPIRASRNIRYYDLESLKKLLNIALLNNRGIKISKLAVLSAEEIAFEASQMLNSNNKNEGALAKIKLAMYGFDKSLFEETYQELILDNSFSTIFQEVFIPFLEFLGLYWHTDTITIAHEHFITSLIYQKLLLQIEKLPPSTGENKCTYVLFLPEEEMHEIGLLYVNYELLLRGYNTIYLGRSIPLKELIHLKAQFPLICLISSFSLTPQIEKLKLYLSNIKFFLDNTPHKYWAIGKIFASGFEAYKSENMQFFTSGKDLPLRK